MDETEQLKASAELGRVLSKFLKSDTGRFISGCVEQDISNAKDEFMELDPYKSTSLQELQNKILGIQFKAKVAIALQDYIGVAIVEGRQAEQQLYTEEAD